MCAEARITGKVTIGAGTVVHPEAVIDATAGPIVIGGNNIIEEQVSLSESNTVLKTTEQVGA